MPNYIVDTTCFRAEGALIDWSRNAKILGLPDVDPALSRFVHLRWMTHASLGLPTEPFKVWSRPRSSREFTTQLALEQRSISFPAPALVVTWTQGTMSRVQLAIQSPAAGIAAAFVGAPAASNITSFVAIPAGASLLTLAAHRIDGVLLPAGTTVSGGQGLPPGAIAASADWTLVETVGLPVKAGEWGSIGGYGSKIGLTGALTDAQTAAVDRLKRGGPPIGWGALLAPGVPAPPWSAPDYPKLVDEVNGSLLDELRPIVAGAPPNGQAAQKITVPLPPPQNSSGQSMSVAGSTSTVAPLTMLLTAASTDPFLALVLGFGTALPRGPALATVSVPVLDYMVTARWEKGLDGSSAPVDYAALVPSPGTSLGAPTPANLVTVPMGVLRPFSTDGSWRASTRVAWDRPPDSALLRASSYALARAGLSPSAAAVALLDNRPSGGPRPIAATSSKTTPPDPEYWRIHGVDRELPIPTNPGTMLVKYAAAMQDLYGQWSPWTAADTTLAQPDLSPVRIAHSALTATLPASGAVCPATLEIDFLWDWSIRSLQQVTFTGVLFAAAGSGDPSPTNTSPATLDRSIGGAQPALTLLFNGGDTPAAVPGVTVKALSEDGEKVVTFGAAQGSNRRFRVIVSGLSLNFGATGHVGLALWARAQEHIPPQRTSAFTEHPFVISAADPRPPVVIVEHVTVASLPDANGQSHARLHWTPQPNAAGYFVYEATETTVLLANGLPEPSPDRTLDQRLKTLKDLFNLRPARDGFTRINSVLIQGQDTDVVLPRGSRSIHLYLVLGVSAGQVESAWPAGPAAADSLSAFAAPHIMQPAPPTIEAVAFLDTAAAPPVYKARITIGTRPGPRPKKLDLHRVRVDDAAKELDSMGPPVLRLASSGAGWTVTSATDAAATTYIASATGPDAPGASWRRVWYRATAWTERDDTRGALPGRSLASNAAWVVIPPATAPTISAPLLFSGPTPNDFVIQWSSTSPVKKTPLGPHRLSFRASLVGAPVNTPPILVLDSPLNGLPTSQPPAGGVWIYNSTPALTVYRALVRRAALTDAVQVAIRLVDPMGRSGSADRTIAGGAILPPPDALNLATSKVAGPPPRTVLNFSSSVPVVAPPDGPYVIRAVAQFRRVLPFLPPPVKTISLAAGDIPPIAPAGPPDIYMVRAPGAGPLFDYTVNCAGTALSFAVTVTGPDLRTITQSVTVL